MPLFLLKKPVDWSLLTDGFNIPLEFQPLVHGLYDSPVAHGEKRNIKILIEGEAFDAKLTNINFNRKTFRGHNDLLQIRYSPGSAIAKKLQGIFRTSYNYIAEARSLPENFRKQVRLPENINEYVTLFSTTIRDTFVLECFTDAENRQLAEDVRQYQEQEYEAADLLTDNSAGYTSRVTKVRRLDQSIGETLKKLYDNRCQITGEKVGEEYGKEVIEAHHIEFFTTSLNNDSSNIIIISPNFHRIIHKNLPEFDRDRLEFRFPNGVIEKVSLDKHLRLL